MAKNKWLDFGDVLADTDEMRVLAHATATASLGGGLRSPIASSMGYALVCACTIWLFKLRPSQVQSGSWLRWFIFLSACLDIDECQMGTHRCGVGQICHNLPGSYRCDCQTGYQYDAVSKVCTGRYPCIRSARMMTSRLEICLPNSFWNQMVSSLFFFQHGKQNKPC